MRRIPLLVLSVLLTAGCGSPAPAVPAAVPEAPASPLTSAPLTSAPPTSAPPTSAPAATARALPVYYLADTPAGIRLQREFHRVTTADPASDAVREMLRPPIDPDYATHWPAGTALRGPVTTAPGLITVDLTGVDGAQVGSEAAAQTVQQLVFTVQGALQSTDPVRILVDGERVDELWGAVATADPVPRGEVWAVRSPVQIDEPAHGASTGRVVRVRGEAAVIEATLLWEVRRDGEVVRSGFTTTAEGQRFAPFEFTVELDPGTYELVILEDDLSGGEGRPVISDDRTITVR